MKILGAILYSDAHNLIKKIGQDPVLDLHVRSVTRIMLYRHR